MNSSRLTPFLCQNLAEKIFKAYPQSAGKLNISQRHKDTTNKSTVTTTATVHKVSIASSTVMNRRDVTQYYHPILMLHTAIFYLF